MVLFQCLLALTSVKEMVSKMKYVKSVYASSLSDMHLQ
jgi:hypothetical protein